MELLPTCPTMPSFSGEDLLVSPLRSENRKALLLQLIFLQLLARANLLPFLQLPPQLATPPTEIPTLRRTFAQFW
jgi:hypothetical protein